ncbi:MAG: methyltransferase domain-containing protein [Nitriliruptorales bacterium]|nr:methyltransferase domain-containing protein [Nitriliruptorales bacterium]
MDAADWNHRYDEGVAWSDEPNARFTGIVSDLPPGRALDLACGQGRNAVWLAQQGWTVTAVDFSSSALVRARDLAAARGVDVTWLEADVVRWQPPLVVYDLVAVLYLHLAPAVRVRVLRHAAAALVPGGTLVVLGHDVRNLEEGHGGPDDPSILLTPSAVVRELGAVDVVTAETVARPVAEEGARDALDTLVVVRAPQVSQHTS